MKKIFLALVLVSSLALAISHKATSCDLSQVGDVTLTLGSQKFQKADYKAVAEVGKNFKSIFNGSVIRVDGAVVTFLDIRADKRVRGKPRTGIITVRLDKDGKTQKIEMPYSYNKGDFSAKGMQKNHKEISFELKIKALLCNTK